MMTTGNNAGTGSHGRFWLQGEPEDKAISGRLFLQPGAHPLLDLDGALTPLIRETSRRKLPAGGEARTSALVPPLELISQSLTVHGTLDETGEPVTLPSAFTVGGGPQRQRLQAFYALLGGHVDGADAQFTRIRVRLCHLDAWAALPGFTLTSDVATGKYALAFEKPEVPPAPLANGARVSIEQVTGWNGPTVCGGHLERQLWLDVLDMPPVPYRDIDRTIVKPLMNLLALTVSAQCAVVAEMVAIGPDHPWLTVHHAGMTAAAEEIIPPPRILLPLTAIGLEGVAAWLESTVRLGPLPSVVARVASSPDDTVESQLVELTTVTEGLHRLLLPERKRMTDAQADEARSKALGALKNFPGDVRDAVQAALQHLTDQSYPRRLLDLAKYVEQAGSRPAASWAPRAGNRWRMVSGTCHRVAGGPRRVRAAEVPREHRRVAGSGTAAGWPERDGDQSADPYPGDDHRRDRTGRLLRLRR